MWTDDLEIVESWGFDLFLSCFDSINSIGVFAATDTFAHMKAPSRTFDWGINWVTLSVNILSYNTTE